MISTRHDPISDLPHLRQIVFVVMALHALMVTRLTEVKVCMVT